jgi:hypothetical protein
MEQGGGGYDDRVSESLLPKTTTEILTLRVRMTIPNGLCRCDHSPVAVKPVNMAFEV